MARMPNPRVLAEVLRSGNLRARLRAAREGLSGVRLQLIAAALDLGLLDALGDGPASTEQLAGRLGVVDHDLLAAYLRVLAAAGLITGEGSWRLTRLGRAVVGDDVVRASYEGFGGYHTELYRDPPSLRRWPGAARHRGERRGDRPALRRDLPVHPRPARPHGHRASAAPGAGHRVRCRPAPGGDARGGSGRHRRRRGRRPRRRGTGPAHPERAGPGRPGQRRGGRHPEGCSPPVARPPSPTPSTWPCSPTSSTTCRSTSGWSCCARSPACSHPAAPSWSSPPWRGRSCSAGTWTCCCGRRRAAWSCLPSTCCSVSSARRACSRTRRSGSALLAAALSAVTAIR